MDDPITPGPAGTSGPPACPCHAGPMRWHRDPRRKAGGYWRCRIKRRESDRRYDATDSRRDSRRRYRESEKGQAALLRYLQSETYRRYRMRVKQRRWQKQIARYEELLGPDGKALSDAFMVFMLRGR